MKIRKTSIFAAVSVAIFCSASTSKAQLLFKDDFDSLESGFNWSVNLSHPGLGDASADFAFDYSTLGIPSAPNSAGTTIGMRFLVNQQSNTFQGISASPVDQHFLGDFKIEFDAWMNFVGPFPGGGNGSTQMASFGWGSSGTAVQWAGANRSVLFAASGDGGTAQDYRVYGAAGGAPLSPDTGVYAAGTLVGSTGAPADSRNNTDPYYSALGSETAPEAQLALFPGQIGTTAAGTFGMAWRDVVIQKKDNVVTWTVDGLLIASVVIDALSLGGENISFGMFDINNPSSTDPNNFLNTAIYDNIRVTIIPEPSSLLLLGVGGMARLSFRRRRRA